MIIIVTVGICLIVATSYITALVCNREFSSEWQEISYTGNSIEPKEIYICKSCNYKADINRHYCSNCGSLMKNGISYHCYSNKIELSEWED